MRIVAVSGGFDPIHIGHIRYLQAAAELGDLLLVILNSDDFLLRKKGYVFMAYEERREILEAIRFVHRVMPAVDGGQTVAESLRHYKPDVFAKGGDRSTWESVDAAEVAVCREIGCEIVLGVGGTDKPQSSSRLVQRVVEALRHG